MVEHKGHAVPFEQHEDSDEDGIVYSQTFDDDDQNEQDAVAKYENSLSSTPEMEKTSSLESVEERMATPSSSREMVVPQVSAAQFLSRSHILIN